MADPVTAVLIGSAIASAAGVAGGLSAEQAAAKSANQALDLKAKQVDLQAEQKKAAEYQKLNANLDRQQAIAAASGTSSRSTSLASLKLGTAKSGAKAQKVIEVEQDIARANIEAERQAIKHKLAGGLFESLGQLGGIGSTVGASLPRGK